MIQPDRRSLLIGACRKRQDQIRQKLAQVRQRLQVTDGLDNERWAQVERDLLARFDQEEERVQRLLNESQESLDAPHSQEATAERAPSAEPATRPEPGRAQLIALQQNYKKAQILVAQKNEQIARLQKELESRAASPSSPDAELLLKEQSIAKLRQQNQALSAQLAKLKAEVVDEEELDELHRQNQALGNALSERDQAALELRAEVARLQVALSVLQEELEELHRQNGALSNELSYRDQQEAELRGEIVRLQEQPPGNEVELEDLQRQNEYLNQELSLRDQSEAQLRGEISRLQAQERIAAELREQNAALSREANEQTEAVLRVQTEFEGKIAALAHQNEILRADLDLKTEVTGRVQFDLELKTGEFDRLSRDHAQRGLQLEQLQAQVDDLVKEATHQSAGIPPELLASQSAAHQQELIEQLTQQAEKHEQELARQLSLQAETLQARVEELQQQLESAATAQVDDEEKQQLQARVVELQQQLEAATPTPADEEEKQQLQARVAELQQQLEAATLAPAEDEEKQQLQARVAELQQQLEAATPTPADEEEKQQLQARVEELQQELEGLHQQLRQSQALVPPEDGEKLQLQTQLAELQQQLELTAQTRASAGDDEENQRLRAQVTQLEEKIALQADKFQLELELLRSAQQYVSDELAKMLETPIGAPAAPLRPPPPVSRSGYLGGDPEESPFQKSGYLGGAPAQPLPARPAVPVASAPKPSGWLGSPDDEPWDGYVRPNYSQAGLPPGAAGAAKMAARAANLGLASSTEEPAELPPLDLDGHSSVEDAPDWLADPVAVEPEELPDWLVTEKPAE